MFIEQHLKLQELTLLPSGEWTPQVHGWLVARVAEGVGYWMQDGAAREFNVGDGFVVGGNVQVLLRSSKLGPLKLQYFGVKPQHLNGLLTVSEWHYLEVASASPLRRIFIFSASEPVAQKFSRILDLQTNHGFSLRCVMLQIWSDALHNFQAAPVSESTDGKKLRDRLHQLIGNMIEAELADASLADLAIQVHCSKKHFGRLFLKEFGVAFRARQIELRLQRALKLLVESNDKIIAIANDSGYRHIGLFNAMFKKRFGVTPSDWRQQNGIKKVSIRKQNRNRFTRLTTGIGLLMTIMFFFSLTATPQTSPTTGDTGAMANVRAALLQKMSEAVAEEKEETVAPQPSPAIGDTEMMAKARAALLQKMAAAAAEEKEAQMRLIREEEYGPVHRIPLSTNAGPRFRVEKYLVMGNSILLPGTIGGIFANVPDAFGTNITFEGIQAALGDLQMAYRERGFVTVSIGLPPQTLTNAEVKMNVTEARLAAINVTGNRWFSTDNVLRALPSLHTNMLLNSHVFQRELDLANASRDRQIYPVIGPGPELLTSALTLKVKDTFPLHARTEVNDDNTPGTPDLRVNSNAQYDNLWNLNHQIGVQYSFSPEQFKGNDYYSSTPFDDPLIANYSGYYRIPLAGIPSVEQQVEGNPASFGYNEVTHKFNLPPATGQPGLNLYASRSTSETGVKYGTLNTITNIPNQVAIYSQDSGDNLTLNEGLGGQLSMPLPQLSGISSTLLIGLDYKNYNELSYNTNNFTIVQYYKDIYGNPTNKTAYVSSGQTPQVTEVQYLPLNIGYNGSVPDSLGTTFFNATVNFNPFGIYSGNEGFAKASYSSNAHANYVVIQSGMTRDLNLYKEWSVRFHADGQWADTPLISNEQYAMGGTSGVRGYQNGVAYGDNGWRATIEPHTPQVSIGMAGNQGDEVSVWVRGSIFMDYGQIYDVDRAGSLDFWGTGFGVTANIGSHLDARLTVSVPLIGQTVPNVVSSGAIQVYFGVGAQF